MKHTNLKRLNKRLLDKGSRSMSAAVESMEVDEVAVDESHAFQVDAGGFDEDVVDKEIIEEISEELNIDGSDEEDGVSISEIEEVIEGNEELTDALESLRVKLPEYFEKHGDISTELRNMGLGIEAHLSKTSSGVEASLSAVAKGIKSAMVDTIAMTMLKIDKTWQNVTQRHTVYMTPMGEETTVGRFVETNLGTRYNALKSKTFDYSTVLSVELIKSHVTVDKIMKLREPSIKYGEALDLYIPKLYEMSLAKGNPFAHPAAFSDWLMFCKALNESMKEYGAVSITNIVDNSIKCLEKYKSTGLSEHIDDLNRELSRIKIINGVTNVKRERTVKTHKFAITDFYPHRLATFLEKTESHRKELLQNYRQLPVLKDQSARIDSLDEAFAGVVQMAAQDEDESTLKSLKEGISRISEIVDDSVYLIESFYQAIDAPRALMEMYVHEAELLESCTMDKYTSELTGEALASVESFTPASALAVIKDKLRSLKVVRRMDTRKLANSKVSNLPRSSNEREFSIDLLDEIESTPELKAFSRFMKSQKLSSFSLSTLEKFMLLSQCFSSKHITTQRILSGETYDDLFGQARTYESQLGDTIQSVQRLLVKGPEGNAGLVTKASTRTQAALANLTALYDKFGKPLEKVDVNKVGDVHIPDTLNRLADVLTASNIVSNALNQKWYDDLVKELEGSALYDNTELEIIWSDLANLITLTSDVIDFSTRIASEFDDVQRIDEIVADAYAQLEAKTV